MFKNILVPLHLDYIDNHEKLFAGALEVLDNEEGKLSLLYVNENRAHGSVYPILDEENEKHYNHDAFIELKKIAKKHSLPEDKITFNIRDGSAHREILEEARRIKADAIVMMATKPGLGSYFISSTSERVMRHAACSVFVIRLTDYQ
ncbi:universal stress protein [Halarcobacter sp.]|uniref:universal stress protein n=1 Tax=Halarcobacter sp. TaxID=2321133 RepID=UPI0029F59B18|nr:universal stress protein [Halarcobacter sp.]